jgi:hypothetical protein
MNKLLFGLAFLLGALAIVSMSWVFAGSDSLALLITVVIGLVFSIGTVELLRFQKATQSLDLALHNIPDFSVEDGSSTDGQFSSWLSRLHSSLRNSVQLRIEGERIGLPAPVVTPYLVGLLVMLGLLGTFVGMVDTLQGAVTALQGTTELEAIRSGLAAPINGLGLAFGTSVAGVAASAMLGLMSTLSRRERVVATRELDACIAHQFKGFSLVHNRQETYKALQAQALALPRVADQLQDMATKLEQMGTSLGEQLNSKQDRFHEDVKESYQDLAKTVSQAISNSVDAVQKGLADSGRLAGESMRPVFEESMKDLVAKVSRQTELGQEQFSQRSAEHLEALNSHISKTAEELGDVWRSADKDRQQNWQQSMEAMQEQSAKSLESATNLVADNLSKVAKGQESAATEFSGQVDRIITSLEEVSKGVSQEWQTRAEQMLTQQTELVERLSQTQETFDQQSVQRADKLMNELEGLFGESTKLLQARQEDESRWLASVDERMSKLTDNVRQELSNLREDEAGRAEAAAETMSKLQLTLSDQVAALAETIEQPMTELIATASETPKVAAEVISKLREEISNNMERDNHLLEERQRIMSELDGLSDSLSRSSENQREAIATLVETSSGMLDKISDRFDQHIDAEVTKLSDIVVEAAASTTDIASLGDAFGQACTLFSESNERLSESLQRIESSLEQSSERSNEQLSYYVAQAREVIDHSVMSQKALFEELRELSMQQQSFEQSTAETV